ncbi:MAG: methyltransferase [Verrucomicrobiia bacterium]
MIYSADDDSGRPSKQLMDLALNAVQEARQLDLKDVAIRTKAEVPYPEVWPGEHYRLLAGLVRVLKPKRVIEVGTAQGLSALALKKYLPPDGCITTFDIVAWDRFVDTSLTAADFSDGRLVQILADLGNGKTFTKYSGLIGSADLLFVDAPKDGVFEPLFFKHMESLNRCGSLCLVIDDIRLWNMLAVWRAISRPKLDLTSFGHWSGTGLVGWCGY